VSLFYADDTTFLVESDKIADLDGIANEQMYKAEAWFLDNIMTLHPSKTRYMLFSHSEPQNSKPELLGQQIERVSESSREKSFKLVGIHLDDKMNWKHNIAKVQTKVSQSTAMIYCSKKFLPNAI
jgi:hypothetical protein